LGGVGGDSCTGVAGIGSCSDGAGVGSGVGIAVAGGKTTDSRIRVGSRDWDWGGGWH
jgi:hypothetical protein